MREFLVGFMIVFHDAQLFKAVNQLEKRLKEAALAMFKVFEELCGALRALPPGADPANAVEAVKDARTFPKLLYDYLTVYQEWFAGEVENQQYSIRHGLITVEALQKFLENFLDDDSREFRNHFWREELRLLMKLLTPECKGRQRIVLGTRAHKLSKLLAPATSVKGNKKSLYELYTLPRSGAATEHALILDPRFRITPVTRYMGNNELALKIYDEVRLWFFKLVKYDLSMKWPHHQRVLLLLEELRDGVASVEKSLERIFNILNVQKRNGVASAMEFLPGCYINDVLDMTIIKEQLRHGIEWTSCVKLVHDVTSILEKLDGFVALLARIVARGPRCCKCRGRRDPACPKARGKGSCYPDAKERWERVKNTMDKAKCKPDQVDAFCWALMFLLDYMGNLRMNTTNFRLSHLALRPRIESIVSQRTFFDNDVKNKKLSVEQTNEWLREAVKMVLDTTPNTFSSYGQDENKAIIAVVYTAAANLVSGANSLMTTKLPETLLYDLALIRKLNAEFHAIVRVSSVLVHVFYIYHISPSKLGNKPMPNDVLATLLKTVAEKVLAAPAGDEMAVAHALEEALQGSGNNDTSSRNWILKGIQPKNEVLNLIKKRLYNVLRLPDKEVANMFCDVNTTRAAYKGLNLPQAALPLANHIRTMVLELRGVMRLNVDVHLTRYKTTIQEELKKLVQAKRAREESANPSEESGVLRKRQNTTKPVGASSPQSRPAPRQKRTRKNSQTSLEKSAVSHKRQRRK